MSQADQSQADQSTDTPIHLQGKPKRSPAEWVTFSIASLLLAFIVGLVVYSWLVPQNQQPPVLSVERDPNIREASGQFYVPFKVANSGGETVESVQIIAELRINGEVEESGEQLIDFLSSNEIEEGAFVFSRNPGEGELIIRVASYTLP